MSAGESGPGPFRSPIGGAPRTQDLDQEALAAWQRRAHTQLIEISRSFLDTRGDQLDTAIRGSLARLSELVEADRAYLLVFEAAPPHRASSVEWCAPGVEPFAFTVNQRDRNRFGWSTAALMQLQPLLLNSPADCPPEGAGEREDLEERGVKSLLGIPIASSSNGFSGYFCFERVHAPKDWRDFEIEHLHLTSEIFASVLRRRRAEQAFDQQLVAERKIAELARLFLAASSEQFGEVAAQTLSAIADLADCDRVVLASFGEGRDGSYDYYEWGAPGVRTHTPETLPWYSAEIESGHVVRLDTLDDLPPEAVLERDDLMRRGVKSSLGIPLRKGRQLVGFMAVETLHEHRRWTQRDVMIFRLVGELFANALARRQSEDDLRESQIQLFQAQKIDAVGRLAGGIAHDFNNLLTVILGFSAGVLAELDADDEVRIDVEEIHAAATRAASLTKQLLAFSRQEMTEVRPVDLHEVIERLEDMLRRLLGENIDLSLDLCTESVRVEGEASQLEQVIINLAVNSRDAMPRGGCLRIATRVVDIDTAQSERLALQGPGLCTVLEVSDDGEGIDEASQSRIFDPFFSTKDPDKGTGLGLSIVYRVVQQLAGSISVKSKPNCGATFEIYLPCSAATPLDENPPVEDGAQRGTERILVVEDEDSVRRLTRRILASNGYIVLEAADGLAALDLASASREEIDMVITDVVMPHMGGRELAAKLRAAHPQIGVMYVSGYSRHASDAGDASLPPGVFLQKPFSDTDLLSRVREVLDARRH